MGIQSIAIELEIEILRLVQLNKLLKNLANITWTVEKIRVDRIAKRLLFYKLNNYCSILCLDTCLYNMKTFTWNNKNKQFCDGNNFVDGRLNSTSKKRFWSSRKIVADSFSQQSPTRTTVNMISPLFNLISCRSEGPPIQEASVWSRLAPFFVRNNEQCGKVCY